MYERPVHAQPGSMRKRASIVAWTRARCASGYCASLLGSLLGAIVFGIGSVYLFGWWVSRYWDDAGLETIGVGLWVVFTAACAGTAVGCFIALRLRRHGRAVATAALMALVVPGASLASFELLPERLTSVALTMIPFVAPLSARRVVLIGRPGGRGGGRRASQGLGGGRA